MSIFKPYDVRGTVPDQLDCATAWKIGRAFALFLSRESGQASPLAVVGRDCRSHSPALTAAFMAGVAAAGGRIADAGLCTTPMLYHAVGSLADTATPPTGGVMVTASHNAPKYNGFKMCRALAAPISMDSGLAEIQRMSLEAVEVPAGIAGLPHSNTPESDRSLPRGVVPESSFFSPVWPVKGKSPGAPCPKGANPSLWASYTAHVASMKRTWPREVHLAIDPANLMGCFYPGLLESLGARVTVTHGELNSTPAHEANPLKPANMVDCMALVRSSGAMMGMAFDGDADRVVFVHGGGEIVPSDLTTGILARSFLRRHPGAAILYDLRCSRAVREIIVESGGRPIRERVGHSFMKATLRAEDCVMGGELAGHFYYRDCFYADNSVVTVIELLNVMGETGKSLAELEASVKRYAQSGEINYHVADKEAVLAKLQATYDKAEQDTIDGITVQFPDWWFNVRPSNTEPLLRLNVEAKDEAAVKARVAEVSRLIGGRPE